MVYFLYDGESVKVGHSKNPRKRVKQLQTGSSSKIQLLGTIYGDKALEKEIHRQFNRFRIINEWFRPEDELIQFINDNIIENRYIHRDDNGKLTSLLRIKAFCDRKR